MPIIKEQLKEFDWEHSNIFGYHKPKASMCDSCRHAYYLEGGSVSMGSISTGEIKNYRQRYCSQRTLAIHMKGVDSCSVYLMKYYNG